MTNLSLKKQKIHGHGLKFHSKCPAVETVESQTRRCADRQGGEGKKERKDLQLCQKIRLLKKCR